MSSVRTPESSVRVCVLLMVAERVDTRGERGGDQRGWTGGSYTFRRDAQSGRRTVKQKC